jgi:ComF family protein
VLPRLSYFKRAALDLFFPQRCLGCGDEGELICHKCRKSLPRIMPPVCPKCGKPQSSGILCSECIIWHTNIEGIRSPLRFEGTVREAVHQFKYKNLRSLSLPLAFLLSDYLQNNPLPLQVLVPVPLHPRRLKERGYNQSGLLAHELGRLINVPVVDDCLTRQKYILPQAQTKSVEERRYNVNKAFYCRSSILHNKKVVLVDDVATSGATLDACAEALKSNGTLSVWGLVLAREL